MSDRSNRSPRTTSHDTLAQEARGPSRAASAPPPDVDWLTLVWARALESRDGRKVTDFIAGSTAIDELGKLEPCKGRRAVMGLVGRGGLPCDIETPSDALHFRLGIAHLDGGVDYPCVVVYSNDEWLATHIVTVSFTWPALIRAIYVVNGPLPGVRVSVLGSSDPH